VGDRRATARHPSSPEESLNARQELPTPGRARYAYRTFLWRMARIRSRAAERADDPASPLEDAAPLLAPLTPSDGTVGGPDCYLRLGGRRSRRLGNARLLVVSRTGLALRDLNTASRSLPTCHGKNTGGRSLRHVCQPGALYRWSLRREDREDVHIHK